MNLCYDDAWRKEGEKKIKNKQAKSEQTVGRMFSGYRQGCNLHGSIISSVTRILTNTINEIKLSLELLYF